MFAIGEASQLSGVNIETIRFYEKRGVVDEPDRAPNGRRMYTEDQVARLRFVKRCRELGFAIEDIVALIGAASKTGDDCASVQKVGKRHLEEIRAKIADLQELEARLSQSLNECATVGGDACPMLSDLLRDPL